MPGGERLHSRHAALLLAAGALLAGPALVVASPLSAGAVEATPPVEPAPAAAPPPSPVPSEIDAFLGFLDRFLGQLLPPPLPPLPPLAPPPPAPPVTVAPVIAVVPVPIVVAEPLTMLRPVSGDMTRGFGMDGDHNHKGLDLDGETGDAVVAAGAGTVIATSCGDGYGKCAVVAHGDGIETWYAHLSEQSVTSGRVARGEVIGLMGCTGSCTGSHLHWEVRVDGVARDPMRFL
jgi:murein DD-endopeptidase MepM/ murein hydrolase activator NlpD